MSDVQRVDVKDVLDAINKINDSNVYSVYIPSLKRTVLFREINTRQEKMLIKTIVDSPVYNTEFIFAMRQVIKENCAETLDTDSLTLIDKVSIALTMRQKSIGDDFEFTFKNTKKTKMIKLGDYINSLKDIQIPEDKTVGDDNIKVVCSYPTIMTEYSIEKEFRSNSENLEVKDMNTARDILGDVFIGEIVKYIKTIELRNDHEWKSIDLQQYNFKNRIKILERIGNKVLKEIMAYIETSNRDIRDRMKIELELNEEDSEKFGTKKLTSILEASSDFFIIS